MNQLSTIANNLAQIAAQLAHIAADQAKSEAQLAATALDTVEKLTQAAEATGALKVTEPKETTEPVEPAPTLEAVRDVLATLARDGHTEEVKALLTARGVQRLSDIPEGDRGALLQEAEAIGNTAQ